MTRKERLDKYYNQLSSPIRNLYPEMKTRFVRMATPYPLHTGQRSLLSSPPEGYTFAWRLRKSKFKNLIRRIFKDDRGIYLREERKGDNEFDLIWSDRIYNGKQKWILEIFDNPFAITGYRYDIFIREYINIAAALEKENCKAIVCTHETAFDFMCKRFPKVRHKIELIRPAIQMPQEIEEHRNPQRILFVGSTNNPNDFYIKGGLEVLKTFESLVNEIGTDAELVIRCKVPDEMRKHIAYLKQREIPTKINLREEPMSYKELLKLYQSSAILFMPSHAYCLVAWLEAMALGLPIVALDTYAVKDYIIDGYNGFVVPKSTEILGYSHPSYPANIRDKDFFTDLRSKDSLRHPKFAGNYIDEKVIFDLKAMLLTLLRYPKVRDKMGDYGRKIFQEKFGIEVRNKKLKEVLDAACA